MEAPIVVSDGDVTSAARKGRSRLHESLAMMGSVMVSSFGTFADGGAIFSDGLLCLAFALGFGSPKREPKPKPKARFWEAVKSFPKLTKAA